MSSTASHLSIIPNPQHIVRMRADQLLGEQENERTKTVDNFPKQSISHFWDKFGMDVPSVSQPIGFKFYPTHHQSKKNIVWIQGTVLKHVNRPLELSPPPSH